MVCDAIAKTPVMRVRWNFEVDIPELGTRLAKAYKRDGRARTELVRAAGISYNHWCDLEQDKVATIPIGTLERIEGALGQKLISESEREAIRKEIEKAAERLVGRSVEG